MTTAAEVFDPQLLRTLRAAPWRTIERRFLFILAASIGLHIVFASYLAAQPMPVDVSIDELEPGFHPQSLPPLLPIPHLANIVTPAAPVRPTVLVRPAPAPAADRAKVAKFGILGVMNGNGHDGAFNGLFDQPGTDIAEALKDARGVVVVNSADTAKGGRTGEAVTVEKMGTNGVKQVALGTRVDNRPAQIPGGPPVIIDRKDIDPKVLQQFIAARRAAVQGCYERALLHNPGLQGGRVVLRLAVGLGGRVNDLDVEEDTLGSEAVTSCMSTLVKRWVFPIAPKEELPISVPFIFARAN